MSISAFDLFTQYVVIKSHFTTNYDAPTYSYKIRPPSFSSFERRRDRKFFEIISKRFRRIETCRGFLIANWVYGKSSKNNLWIGDLIEKQTSEETFSQQIIFFEGLTYHLKSDIITLSDLAKTKQLENGFDGLLRAIEPDTDFPWIINATLRRQINVESLLMIDELSGFLKRINRSMDDNLIWNRFYLKVNKYRSLLLQKEKEWHPFRLLPQKKTIEVIKESIKN